MHQVQTLTTLVTTITADTREDTEVTEDMEATVASAVMAVVTNALAPPSPTVVGQKRFFSDGLSNPESRHSTQWAWCIRMAPSQTQFHFIDVKANQEAHPIPLASGPSCGTSIARRCFLETKARAATGDSF